MSNQCAICNKRTQVGISSRHHRGVAGKQWLKRAQKTKRTFKPNIQWANLDGIRIRVCTKCLKLIKKQQPSGIPAETASK
jgi:ribosomal protein L28